jgi:GFO/IDH/MocA oxidoreductase family protein
MKPTSKWKIAGINFDHDHMGDNLRMVFNHPNAEIVGICHEDPRRMERAIQNFSIPPERVFTDYRACLESTKPDIVLLCPATAPGRHPRSSMAEPSAVFYSLPGNRRAGAGAPVPRDLSDRSADCRFRRPQRSSQTHGQTAVDFF